MSEERSERAVYTKTKQAVTNDATFDPQASRPPPRSAITLSASVLPPDFPQSHEKQRGVSPSSEPSRWDSDESPRDVPPEEARLGGGGGLAASSSSREEKHWAGGRFFPVKTGGGDAPTDGIQPLSLSR